MTPNERCKWMGHSEAYMAGLCDCALADVEPTEVQWHCICGEGDDAEFHNILCVGSNTPDDVWSGASEL